jgi:hypothetical protein
MDFMSAFRGHDQLSPRGQLNQEALIFIVNPDNLCERLRASEGSDRRLWNRVVERARREDNEGHIPQAGRFAGLTR